MVEHIQAKSRNNKVSSKIKRKSTQKELIICPEKNKEAALKKTSADTMSRQITCV